MKFMQRFPIIPHGSLSFMLRQEDLGGTDTDPDLQIIFRSKLFLRPLQNNFVVTHEQSNPKLRIPTLASE